MERIVVEVVTGDKPHGEYYTFASHEILVGRGLKSDLIVNDPYVSARHLLISRTEDEIRVKDLATKNGTYLRRLKQAVSDAAIVSGDELVLGTTTIRIFSDAHHVQPARALRQRSPYITWMRKPVVAWCLAGLLAGLALLAAYLDTDSKTPFVKLLPYPIITLVGMLLWAGAWSFVGRFARHKIRLAIHVSIICLFLILGEILEDLSDVIGFYVNSPVIEELLVNAIWAGLSVIFLYASFNAATNMRHNTKVLVSSGFTVLCLAAAVGLFASSRDYYFTGDIPYSDTLKPPLLGAPPGQSIDAFMTRADRVFEFDIRDE